MEKVNVSFGKNDDGMVVIRIGMTVLFVPPLQAMHMARDLVTAAVSADVDGKREQHTIN